MNDGLALRAPLHRVARMATTLLYHRDPMLLAFDARVVAHASHAGRPSVVLDETAFYPEAGGQMADRGVLAGRAIVDVQVDDAGTVHHVLDGDAPLPDVGAAVHGDIERARRRMFMSLHTGQHMLSRALVDIAKAETVSARLGETSCTIDADVPALSDKALAEAESLVNAVVDDDVAIRAWFPDAAELATLPLRRKPKVDENIRVVSVGGFDVSPCGGTHCITSAQVGLVRVIGVEKYKGKTRVTFDAGPRARRALLDEAGALKALASGLSCGPLDVSTALDKVRRDLAAVRDTNKRLAERVAVAVADELAASGTNPIVAVLDDKELVRLVGARLMALEGRHALLAARDDDGMHVLAVRGPGSTFDCGAFIKKLATEHGGKGGGKPERAEGRVPGSVDWRAVAGA